LIGSAIGAAESGDTVHVAAATYVENINFNGKNIAVIGADRETTIIDGNQSGTVVTFENGEDSTAVLSGFTLQNGSGTLNGSNTVGGGVFINSNDSQPTLEYLKIINNTATQGSGVFIDYYSGVAVLFIIFKYSSVG
jgi:hypothetical protein